MFCSQCGTKNNEGDMFCGNCGNALSVAKTSKSATSLIEKLPFDKKTLSFIAMGLAAVLVIFMISGLFSGGYSQSTPEKAAYSLFKSVQKENPETFLNLLSPDTTQYLRLFMTQKEINQAVKELLAELNDDIKDETGKRNWLSSIKVKQVYINSAGNYAEVEITFKGERMSIDLEKIGNKWYVDENFF